MAETADVEEFDFLSLGAGFAGMAGALTATDLGMRALVVGKTALLGGVTAYSNGQLWAGGTSLQAAAGIEDSPSAVLGYLKRLGMGFCDETDGRGIRAARRAGPRLLRAVDRRALAAGRGLARLLLPELPDALEEGRYVEVEPFRGEDLGERRELLRVSPHVPYRLTSADMLRFGGGVKCAPLGSIVDAGAPACGHAGVRDRTGGVLHEGATRRGCADHDQCRAGRAVSIDGRESGVRLRTSAGERTVMARRGVLIAMGGYDWNADEMRAFEGQLEIRSAAPPAVAGDHLRLVSAVGERSPRFQSRSGWATP